MTQPRFDIEFNQDLWAVVPAEDGPYASEAEAQAECDRKNGRLESCKGNESALELELLGQSLDLIESVTSREQRIAALRCFMRGLQGKQNLEEDVLLLAMRGPK